MRNIRCVEEGVYTGWSKTLNHDYKAVNKIIFFVKFILKY